MNAPAQSNGNDRGNLPSADLVDQMLANEQLRKKIAKAVLYQGGLAIWTMAAAFGLTATAFLGWMSEARTYYLALESAQTSLNELESNVKATSDIAESAHVVAKAAQSIANQAVDFASKTAKTEARLAASDAVFAAMDKLNRDFASYENRMDSRFVSLYGGLADHSRSELTSLSSLQADLTSQIGALRPVVDRLARWSSAAAGGATDVSIEILPARKAVELADWGINLSARKISEDGITYVEIETRDGKSIARARTQSYGSPLVFVSGDHCVSVEFSKRFGFSSKAIVVANRWAIPATRLDGHTPVNDMNVIERCGAPRHVFPNDPTIDSTAETIVSR